MTTTTLLIISAIISAFLLFGGVLAWSDFYSRGARREPLVPEEPASATVQTSIEQRKAA
jgi:hypothetical protein